MQTSVPSQQVTILSDFDGTITPLDLSDFIFSRFAACGLKYAKQWSQGLIGTREEIDRSLATITSGPDEIATALKSVPIDPTFHELIALTRQQNLGLAVVSDGLDWLIKIVLEEHGIQDLPVYSNHMTFEGQHPVCSYPWYDPSTPRMGTCKPLIIRQYRNKNNRIVFIGDGRSDNEAALEADLVFAKDALADYCRAQDIKAFGFKTFTDICSQMIPWLAQIKIGVAAGNSTNP